MKIMEHQEVEIDLAFWEGLITRNMYDIIRDFLHAQALSEREEYISFFLFSFHSCIIKYVITTKAITESAFSSTCEKLTRRKLYAW
jgi:hypothetical protein